VRGATKRLVTDGTDAEATVAQALTSFNSDGFTVGTDSDVNGSTYPIVSWAWDAGTSTASNTSGTITSTVRANTSAGFSVVTVNSTTVGTIGHGLGVKPAMIIEKCLGTTSNWYVRHKSLTNMAAYYLVLNSTAAASSDTTAWNNTEPTSTTISINNSYLYANGSVVYYCFAEVAGYSAFGSYVGNGLSDGPFVYTGFRPRWVLIHNSSGGGDWTILDTARSTYNVSGPYLYPNLTNAEGDTAILDFISNGFKIRNTFGNFNASSNTYIYAAFAENPFKISRAR
jgi:hypothetical protein